MAATAIARIATWSGLISSCGSALAILAKEISLL